MNLRSPKTVYTTGEVARICSISQQTVIRCFDSGRLRGFRVPGSRFRRIPRDRLVSFMKDNHIRHLPVMEDGVVIGMLSLRDLFSTIIDDQASTIDQLQHYIRGEV